jgi:hypothetical protein
MGDDWKYLVLDLADAGETMLIFPPHSIHAEVADRFPGIEILSAGFINYSHTERKLQCYGRSDSLRLGAKETDSILATRLLGRFDMPF